MEFKDNLKELRVLKSISQKDLAKIFNVGFSTMSMWEQGKRSPDKETLIKIANYFNVSVDFLLGNSMDGNEVCKKILEEDKIKTLSIKNMVNLIEGNSISNRSHELKEKITLEEIEFIIKYLDILGIDLVKILEVRREIKR